MSENQHGDYRFSVSLQVRHPTRDTEPFSGIVGKRPCRAWRVGEPRTTVKGEALIGTYPESYCYFDLGKGEGANLVRCLRAANRQLGKHRGKLAEWRRGGGSLHYYVHLYGLGRAVAEVLPSALLLEIGSLGIEFGLEVFCAEGDPPKLQSMEPVGSTGSP